MREPDEDERREAIDERRARTRSTACACGNPDWPGSCPGPRNCPANNYGRTEDEVEAERQGAVKVLVADASEEIFVLLADLSKALSKHGADVTAVSIDAGNFGVTIETGDV